MEEKKIMCYELDFGDMNYISTSIKDIMNWIEADMQSLKEGDDLQYEITTKMLTQKEIDAIPEWC